MIQGKPKTVNSRILVDWVSFTCPMAGENVPQTKSEIRTALRYTWAKWIGALPDCRVTPGPGRAGYNASITNETSTITAYGRMGDDDVLIEVSGQGCELLRKNKMLDNLLRAAQYTATRLDIAVDFETVTRPVDFANTCQNDRVKTRSSITSPTGETEYLGSRKSARYCRVYRYAKPHPRARYLRLEMVMRKELARQSIRCILKAGLQTAADRASATWKFSHPIYPFMGANPIQAHRAESDMGNTVRWFHVQVVPALRRLLDSEALTWEEIANAISDR